VFAWKTWGSGRFLNQTNNAMDTSSDKPQNLKGFRGFVSVTDKSGLHLLKQLTDAGAELVSTGGTAKMLRETHMTPCTEVSDVTGFPEMLGGRVKTLHPKIQGGLLADTSQQDHLEQIQKHGIKPFHFVMVNLYDFEKNPSIEEIDIGGPTGLRAAAKNGLIVVVDVKDYKRVIQQMLANDGIITEKLREELIVKVFKITAKYDSMIAKWMEGQRKANKPLFNLPLASKKNRVEEDAIPSSGPNEETGG
jgi:phosphoribosylaminoimidazolecarboxamide formyltransferase/IMP cyclohydrolase